MPEKVYDVALSFAGQDREYAEQLAELLQTAGYKVFYDKYEQAKLWGKNLYQHLTWVYGEQAQYCVMFISRAYLEKAWTQLEQRAAQEAAFLQKVEYILPVRIDDTEIPGILRTVAYLDIRQVSIETIAALLVEKLEDQSALSQLDIQQTTSAGQSAVEARSRSTDGGIPSEESAPTSRRRLLTIAGVVVVAAGLVVAGITTSGIGTPSTPPAPSSTTTAAAGPTTTVVSDAVLADDFSGPSLDAGRWKPPSRADVISQADGHLVLSTRPGRGVDYTKLQPLELSRPFVDVTFTVVIPEYAQGGQGGGSFVLNPTGKQPQILAMGSGADGGVVITPLPCDKPSCRLAVYEDFTEPPATNPAPIKPGETVKVEIVKKDGRLLFYSKGILIGASKIDPGPLTDFWFAATAGPQESWDVRIDDLVVR